jgi:hypothetical protein
MTQMASSFSMPTPGTLASQPSTGPWLSQGTPNTGANSSWDDPAVQYQAMNDLMGSTLTPDQAAFVAAPINNALSMAVVPVVAGKVLPALNTATKAADSGAANLASLQTKLENLADEHLLPQFRAIDPNLEAGYTGSFKTGVVGNPNKATFGQPIDLSNFDIDYWIKSDTLYQQYGNSLKANVGFRQILSETPGFEGLKPNKGCFSIKFLPSSP